ncbi:MAG: Uma2 family endonuclease [Terriglobales bacterium]|jgi:Uma2 family endonuclease
MATTTQLMTVEEARKLPQDKGSVYHELRHGELVAVTRPKFKHYLLQDRLREQLRALAPPGGFVGYEFAFRPLTEYELRVADVAYVNPERAAHMDPEDNLRGAPDMVIEILSPSKTVAEMYDKEKLCLENGSSEFWVADLDRHQVKVSTPDGRTVTYTSGQAIPLPLFGGRQLSVDVVFG